MKTYTIYVHLENKGLLQFTVEVNDICEFLKQFNDFDSLVISALDGTFFLNTKFIISVAAKELIKPEN